MAEKRTRTTMSGQPRSKTKYGLRELLDDYGPMSNLMRLLRGHDDEIPAMPSGLGGLGFDIFDSDKNRRTLREMQDDERKRFAKILERRKREMEKKENEEALNKKEARGRKAMRGAD